jgi:cytochrome c biogenesis factor
MSIQKPLQTEEILRIVSEMEQSVQQGKSSRNQKKKRSFFSWVRRILVSISLVTLTISSTILFLPRLSIYYTSLEFNPAISIGFAIFVLFFIWLIILTLISILITGKPIVNRFVRNSVLFTLLIYTIFTTFFMSGTNFKSKGIQETYLNLHPVLRLGLTTTILVDSDLMITDAQRTKEDYKKWGLSPLERSDHYVQKNTGYVHAADIRTIGRPEWKNQLTELAFKLMGFKTLRHVGTADHLHISIPKNN